jgi:transmembrane sensor
MSNEEFIALAAKVAEGKASTAELALYNAGYDSFQHQQIGGALPSNIGELEKKSLHDLRESFGIQTKRIKLWPRIATAAAVAAVVFGIWFFNSNTNPDAGKGHGSAQYANDIKPGKNTATLTLANGKTINLSDAKTGVIVDASKLTYNDGSLVQYSSGSHFSGSQKSDQKNTGPVRVTSLGVAEQLTASTPRGGTYTVTLPDGTKVWLNAASSLKFPSHFANVSERRVELSGEAYFEVFKNKKQPFVVNSKKLEVTVLGTHFNINAYEDEGSPKTTLLEGSVRVANRLAHTNRTGEVILKPEQQATLTKNNTISIQDVDAAAAVLWKSGKFSFASEEIGSIMKQVSRWYDVEIVFRDHVESTKVTGSVSRFANISVLLEKLEQTGLVHFKVEGRKVYVSK